MKFVSPDEMREMDRRTIEEYGISSAVLMEHAALRVYETIVARHDLTAKSKVLVLCGCGNNGGDALALARLLWCRLRLRADVRFVSPEAEYSRQALDQLRILEAYGVTPRTSCRAADLKARGYDLVVDGIFGTGFEDEPDSDISTIIGVVNAMHAPRCAIDVPSGLDAATGKVLGACIRAEYTVTFALPKYGLLVFPGVDYVGELIMADIGMPPKLMRGESTCTVTELADVARLLPSRQETENSNKGTYGHVAVFAGSLGFLGAACLASDSAARMGAGLVTLSVPNGAFLPAMTRISPVIMTTGLPETSAHTFALSALAPALTLVDRCDAAAIGPGISVAQDPDTGKFVESFVQQCAKPLVIDADALTALSKLADRGQACVAKRTAPTVLTPHPGEMGRLMGITTAQVQAERRSVVEECARHYNCVVLLKGARTLIATPEGAIAINTTGNAGMGNGGTGDVLTGIIGSLLAQGLTAFDAARVGAYVHGLAGDLRARDIGGEAGIIASDIIEYLPRAMAACRNSEKL